MSAAFDNGSLAAARAFVPSDAAPPLVKIAALLATGYAVHRSLSPPNPPPAPKTCIDNRTLFERAIRHVTFCTKVSVQIRCRCLVAKHEHAGWSLAGPCYRIPCQIALCPAMGELQAARNVRLAARVPCHWPAGSRSLCHPKAILRSDSSGRILDERWDSRVARGSGGRKLSSAPAAARPPWRSRQTLAGKPTLFRVVQPR